MSKFYKPNHLPGCRKFAVFGGNPFGVKPGGISFNRGWKPCKWFNGAGGTVAGNAGCGGRYELTFSFSIRSASARADTSHGSKPKTISAVQWNYIRNAWYVHRCITQGHRLHTVSKNMLLTSERLTIRQWMGYNDKWLCNDSANSNTIQIRKILPIFNQHDFPFIN